MLDLPPGYLAALEAHCTARGMLLILDEAQTGVGRTGQMFAFERDGLAKRAAIAGGRLAAGLHGLMQRHPCVGDVRGLLMGLEFADTGGKSAAQISDAVTDGALEIGLCANIVRTGTSDGTMRIAPPLTVTDAEIDLGVELLDQAIRRATSR